MALGRPTDYSDKIQKKADKYLSSYKTQVPTVAGLAAYIKVAKSTVYLWAKKDECKAFSDVVEDILIAQEESLIDKGLSGHYNPTIAKLMLTKHGYSDKQETTHAGKVEVTDLTEYQLDLKLKALIDATG